MFGPAADEEIVEARRLLRHEFHFLGHPMHHDRGIAWSRDPVTGNEWSRGFSADIPYRGPGRLGDIKLPWELNKHQYFFTLGKAAWLTDDPAFADEIIEQIDQWIEANPCYSGINWISALEVGTRAVAWILAYPFFADRCESAFSERMLRSLAQHLLFVERNLSIGEFANTHLAGEAAILIIGGLFVDCRHSKRWQALGLRQMYLQILRQVRSDGVHAEQSIAYHRFFLDHYALVGAMLGANGRSLAAPVLECMERMTQFLMDVMHPDGSVPAFGDSDDARGIWCHAKAPKDYKSLLVLGATTFNRGDFKMIARTATEELLWLYGESGIEAFVKLPPRAPEHTSAAYADAGYYVMRGGWGPSDPVLVFDCGPLGHGPSGHGHADALSLQLYARGYPFLVDPGTFSYNLDYAWRQGFRSTRAHNTVTIDGQDQSLSGDRMSWITAAKAHCHRWISTPWFDLVDGEHDGYNRLPGPVNHRRVIVFIKPDVWVIMDRLAGRGRHHVQMSLQLRPDCTVSPLPADHTVLESPAGGRLRMSILGQTPAFIESGNSFADIPESWSSAAYGEKVRTRALHVSGSIDGVGTVTTGLTTSSDAVVLASWAGNGLQISMKRGNHPPEIFYYAFERGSSFAATDLRFDGDVLYQCRRSMDDRTLWASGFRTLHIDGYLEVSSASAINSIALHRNSCDVACDADQAVKAESKADSTIRMNILRE